MVSFIHLVVNRIWVPADPRESFEGKTILVTGANMGIGYAVAVKLIQSGCTDLIIGVRSLDKGETAKRSIEKETGCADTVIKVWEIDQASFASVAAFAKKAGQLKKLDMVVLNAGVLRESFNLTGDGWEETLQVNTLSTTLLALLLVPKLLEVQSDFTHGSRHLHFVSSGGVIRADSSSLQGNQVLKKLNSPTNGISGQQHYELTKLLLEYAMIGVADLPSIRAANEKEPTLIVNSSYPGTCCSGIIRERIKDSKTTPYIMSIVLRSAEQGARSIVSGLALGSESHGKYWWNDELADRGANVDSDEGRELQRKSWTEITEVCRSVAPEVGQIIGDK